MCDWLEEQLDAGGVFIDGTGLLPDRTEKLRKVRVIGELVPAKHAWIRTRVAENNYGMTCHTFRGIFATEVEAMVAVDEPARASCSCGEGCFVGQPQFQVRKLVLVKESHEDERSDI